MDIVSILLTIVITIGVVTLAAYFLSFLRGLAEKTETKVDDKLVDSIEDYITKNPDKLNQLQERLEAELEKRKSKE